MNEETFLSALHESPDDEVTWLALADWLDENGQAERAELLRLVRRLRTLPATASKNARAKLERRVAALLRAGVRPVAPEVTADAGIRLILITPGAFVMPPPYWERWRPRDADADAPQHVAVARPFYLGAFPVTQAQYEKVTGHNPSRFRPDGPGADRVAGLSTADFPVETVSWQDADDFCRKLSEKSARFAYRLPSVMEWVYASRAGGVVSTPFPTGSRLDSTLANFNGSRTGRPNLARTCAVGAYPPNVWGLYDLYGNVWEWCQEATGGGIYRAVRGNNWRATGIHPADVLERGGNFPGGRDDCVGFRVAAEPAGGKRP
jgi:uncharacterized protein (TIGR02996 family)